MSNETNSTIQYVQKILFGSPGTGKSYRIADGEDSIANELGINNKEENIFRTVFHPEYKYGDFMGKLLPHTNESGFITYKFYSGIFLKALAKAYKNILDGGNSSVLLVIDEINRGNSAAIFGTVFQLLDRDDDGWSSYNVSLSDLEFNTLIEEMGLIKSKDKDDTFLDKDKNEVDLRNLNFLKRNSVKLPPNLSIVGTMNTSDESIYYMDSAFKRRWDWEYVPTYGEIVDVYTIKQEDVSLENAIISNWDNFFKKINEFILKNDKYVRKVEDKLIGEWFLKEKDRNLKAVQNKLMFFLWDTVFQRDKTPLNKLLELSEEEKLKTFGDFANLIVEFVNSFDIEVYKNTTSEEDDNNIQTYEEPTQDESKSNYSSENE